METSSETHVGHRRRAEDSVEGDDKRAVKHQKREDCAEEAVLSSQMNKMAIDDVDARRGSGRAWAISSTQTARDQKGYTPVQEEALHILVEKLKGLNLGGPSYYNRRMKLVRDAIVKHTIHPDDIIYETDTNVSILFDTVLQNDTDAVEFLLKHGANPRTFVQLVTGENKEVLFYAKSKKVAQLLLQYGASAAIKDQLGRTLLLQIANHANYSPQLISLYIQNCGDISDTIEARSLIALIVCSSDYYEKINELYIKARLLVLYGIPLNTKITGRANDGHTWNTLLQHDIDKSHGQTKQQLIGLKQVIESTIQERQSIEKQYLAAAAQKIYQDTSLPQEVAGIIGSYLPPTTAFVMAYLQSKSNQKPTS